MIVDAANGDEVASAIFSYPRWRDGLYCDPQNQRFRQHPLDYIEGLEDTIRSCLRQAGPGASGMICALSIDSTGSTPVAVDSGGTPLSLLSGFEQDPDAMFVLWKDHTAVLEASEINRHAANSTEDYLQFVGGVYSSEWFWAKLLHILRANPAVRLACYSWVEHCDWIPFLLCGGSRVAEMKRSVCAAGHKALWSAEFGGLPPNAFFSSLDKLLDGFTDRLFTRTSAASEGAGRLSPAWAERLGLTKGLVVGVGAFDAHMGAVGGQIEPYHLSKVMGTSTCDMLVAPLADMGNKLVRGICGQVPGSILPGMMGMEAGQSAFGDSYAWFRDLLCWPLLHVHSLSSDTDPERYKSLAGEISASLISELSLQAARLPPAQPEFALDWLNGRRSPDANQSLKAALVGLQLGSDAPRLFRSIVESTCFGAKAIVDCFTSQHVPVRGLIGLGGVAKKSGFVMQMMADILEMPIRIHRSEQTCAMGAAMFAATAAGLYGRVEEAMEAMGKGFDVQYLPEPSHQAEYRRRYNKYRQLGNFVEKEFTAAQ
jgi:L-ribulokinase